MLKFVGTIGAGGHSLAILEASGPDGRIVGLDRDATAVATSRQALLPYGDRAVIVQAAYGDALHVVRETTERSLDGALLDLGVSSQQLDTPARGFSFLANGPLDMRRDVRDSVTAADLVNRLPEKDLIQTLEKHGEERYARRIVKGTDGSTAPRGPFRRCGSPSTTNSKASNQRCDRSLRYCVPAVGLWSSPSIRSKTAS